MLWRHMQELWFIFILSIKICTMDCTEYGFYYRTVVSVDSLRASSSRSTRLLRAGRSNGFRGLASVNCIPLAREDSSRLTSLHMLHATRRRCELVRRMAEATKNSDHDLDVNDSTPYTQVLWSPS